MLSCIQVGLNENTIAPQISDVNLLNYSCHRASFIACCHSILALRQECFI